MDDETRPARAIDDAPAEEAPPAEAPASDGATADGAARPRRALGKQRHLGRWVLIILSLLLAVALALGGAFAWRAMNAISQIKRDPSFAPTASDRPTPVVTGPITFLLLGADTRPKDDEELGGDPGRSDTMIIGYVPKNRQHLYLISVPRDTWVPIPGHEYGKVNAAYAIGGVSLAWETVEKLLGVRLEHAGIIDFVGFMKLTDSLDGVTVYNPIESDVFFCHYPKGTITIKGECALYYVRQRDDLPGGDLDRMARQRAVIGAIVNKALKGGIMSNPSKMDDFMQQVSKVVTVDRSLTDDKIRNYALSMRIDSGDDVRTMTMPMARSDYSEDGQWIDVVDQVAIDELAYAMKTDTMDAYYERHKDEDPYTGAETPEIPFGPVPSSATPRTPATTFPTTKRPKLSPGTPTATPTAPATPRRPRSTGVSPTSRPS